MHTLANRVTAGLVLAGSIGSTASAELPIDVHVLEHTETKVRMKARMWEPGSSWNEAFGTSWWTTDSSYASFGDKLHVAHIDVINREVDSNGLSYSIKKRISGCTALMVP